MNFGMNTNIDEPMASDLFHSQRGSPTILFCHQTFPFSFWVLIVLQLEYTYTCILFYFIMIGTNRSEINLSV